MSMSVSTSRATPRRILAILVALCMLVALSTALDARPAAATTAAAKTKFGIVRVCLKAPVVLSGVTYWGPYNRPVNVDAYYGGHWHKRATTTPNLHGCVAMKLQGGYKWRYRVYHYEAQTWYIGRSKTVKVKAGHKYRLPTVWLQALTT